MVEVVSTEKHRSYKQPPVHNQPHNLKTSVLHRQIFEVQIMQSIPIKFQWTTLPPTKEDTYDLLVHVPEYNPDIEENIKAQ